MGWELEARLAGRGAGCMDVDGLMRLAEKNGDARTVAKLEGIRERMAKSGCVLERIDNAVPAPCI